MIGRRVARELLAIMLTSVLFSACGRPEVCTLGDDAYPEGAHFLDSQACNGCVCEEGGAACTLMACLDCLLYTSRDACTDMGCRWESACGADAAVGERCYPADTCTSDDDCGPDSRCATRELQIDASCQPHAFCAPPCRLGVLDDAGACVSGVTGEPLDAGCCDRQYLCESTGGTWHAGACAHYVCGREPDCAPEPRGGCDCGERETYVPTQGCQRAKSCN